MVDFYPPKEQYISADDILQRIMSSGQTASINLTDEDLRQFEEEEQKKESLELQQKLLKMRENLMGAMSQDEEKRMSSISELETAIRKNPIETLNLYSIARNIIVRSDGSISVKPTKEEMDDFNDLIMLMVHQQKGGLDKEYQQIIEQNPLYRGWVYKNLKQTFANQPVEMVQSPDGSLVFRVGSPPEQLQLIEGLTQQGISAERILKIPPTLKEQQQQVKELMEEASKMGVAVQNVQFTPEGTNVIIGRPPNDLTDLLKLRQLNPDLAIVQDEYGRQLRFESTTGFQNTAQYQTAVGKYINEIGKSIGRLLEGFSVVHFNKALSNFDALGSLMIGVPPEDLQRVREAAKVLGGAISPGLDPKAELEGKSPSQYKIKIDPVQELKQFITDGSSIYGQAIYDLLSVADIDSEYPIQLKTAADQFLRLVTLAPKQKQKYGNVLGELLSLYEQIKASENNQIRNEIETFAEEPPVQFPRPRKSQGFSQSYSFPRRGEETNVLRKFLMGQISYSELQRMNKQLLMRQAQTLTPEEQKRLAEKLRLLISNSPKQ